MKNNSLREIVKAFKKHDDYILSTHINPDGDGIGAEIALGFGLKKLGKKVIISNSDPFPENYEFLPCNGLLKEKDAVKSSYNVAVSLECSGLSRVGKLKKVFLKSKKIINLDHHSSNDYFGDYNYVDDKAAAVGEQVYYILLGLGVKIDLDIATCIYTSLLTDTGSFAYSNTTRKTHQIVVELLDYGVNPSEVYQNVYEVSSLGKIQLLGKALNSLHADKKRGVAWITLMKDSFRKTGTLYGDSEGIINYARSIKGVNVAISFTELENGRVKISFRSKRDDIDVNKIALSFKGGGHKRASGAVIEGNMKEVKEKVLKKVFEEIVSA
ncbi:MAG: bifunctional oligoribonuclease/PAP phosphatase NrnA [Candidatus Firestonebacteria bacterium]